MDPDVISPGREPSSWLDLSQAAAGRGRPRSRILARRFGVPVLGVVLLLAVAVFVVTRPDGPTVIRGGPAIRTTTTEPPDPTDSVPQPGPVSTERRPSADIPPDLVDKVALMLSANDGLTLNTQRLVGSDYEAGFDVVAVAGNLMQGTLIVELACVGTGKIQIWVEDAAKVKDPTRENTDPPIDMDCAGLAGATVSTTLTGAGFFVKAVIDSDTAAVLGYVALIRTTQM